MKWAGTIVSSELAPRSRKSAHYGGRVNRDSFNLSPLEALIYCSVPLRLSVVQGNTFPHNFAAYSLT